MGSIAFAVYEHRKYIHARSYIDRVAGYVEFAEAFLEANASKKKKQENSEE